MANITRAAAVQMNSTEDVARNLETADRLTREAAERGATLIALPEKWTVLGSGPALAEHAQTLDGPAMEWARQIAGELEIDLIAGSFAERRDGQAKGSNTSVHIGPDGQMHGIYRKLHMFDVEVGGVLYAESAHEQAGDEVMVSPLAIGRQLGMTICYDVRFPELYRELSSRGADVFTVPAAFTLATTRDHWEVLLRARAVENQAFVIAPNQIGENIPGNHSGGRSMIINPWGTVLATAADSECTIVADLDWDMMNDIRRRVPALTHRRSADLYPGEPKPTEPSGPAPVEPVG
jgi:deaminated glutathione amidase